MIVRALPPLGLLVTFALLAVTSLYQKSITGDEVTHLPAGYTYVRTGDFRLNPQHPPLMKALAGIPLLLLNLKPVEEAPGWHRAREWAFGRDFLVNNRTPLRQIVFLGRLPMVGVGLLLGFVLFLWARDLWGYGVGLCVLFLYTFSPTVLAHTRVVHTDVGVSCLTVLTLYALWKFSRSGRFTHAAWCGVALGLTLLAKYSGVLTAAMVALLLPASCYRHTWNGSLEAAGAPVERDGRERLKRWVMLACAAGLVVLPALVLITVGFGFPNGLASYADGYRVIHADRNPHWEGFLWGEYSPTGFWYYYLLAQIWKTPLPTLVLFCASLLLLRVRSRSDLLDWAFILLPIAVFHAAGMTYKSSIGVRHILPAYPFMFLACGAAAQWVRGQRRLYKAAFAFLCLWYVAGTLRVYPHFIPYFNELAGGPDNGISYLDDSNIEWGQDFYLLKDYIAATAPRTVRISAFKPIRPEHYGIEWQAISLRDVVWPQPGVTYFAGASYLQRSSLYNEHPGVRFHWLERYRPVDKIGWSIFVYRFSIDPAAAGTSDVFYITRERWFADAIATLQPIVSQSPRFSEARNLLAEVHIARADWLADAGELQAAMADYLSAVRLVPGDATHRARVREAIVQLPGSVTAAPGLPASYYYTEAFRSGKQGATAEALRAYLQALEQDPAHLGARFNLGQLYARLGFLNLAEREWRECVRLRPGYDPAMQSLRRARQMRGRRPGGYPQ